jgi:hypothetical protein
VDEVVVGVGVMSGVGGVSGGVSGVSGVRGMSGVCVLGWMIRMS